MIPTLNPLRRSPFLRAGILALTAVLAAMACGSPTPGGTTPTPTSGGVPAGWICYQNTTYGFEVCYPPDAAFTTASPEHSRIDLPIAPDTNLMEKWMDVDARVGLSSCVSPWSENYPPASITTGTQTIGGLTFTVQSGEEGAAGNYYRWISWSTERDGVCASLTGFLHSTNPGNYSTPPPEFDLPAESAVFDQIVATFRWLEPPTSSVPPGWICYQNALYAFEVCYPPDATLSDETPDHVRINLSIVPGTNLHEKWMDVDGRYTPPACESPQAAGYGPGGVTAETRMIAGLTFLVQSGSEGAAGSIYSWTGYSTEDSGVCASLTGVLHAVQPGNYSSPPPEFDEAAESAVFDQIAETFRWLGAAPSAEAAENAATATFTANTNCRRGASINHEVVTYLPEGITAPIVGRNEDSSWWLVQVPGSPIRCWVWGEFVITHGPAAAAPFVQSPELGCWVQGPRDKRPYCAVPCPEGAKPGGVCEP
jgi:hypothetical protein